MLFTAIPAFAKGEKSDKNVQVRLFVGKHSFDSSTVNTYTEAQNINKLDSSMFAGVELSKPIIGGVSVGLRGQWKWQRQNEKGDPPIAINRPYYIDLKQEQVIAITRIPIVAQAAVRFDVFGGAGLSSTTKFETRTASGLETYESVNTFMTMAGGSVSVGYGNMFLTVEAGQEFNNIKELKSTNGVPGSIASFDMTGTFVTAGLLFTGVPSWIKMK